MKPTSEQTTTIQRLLTDLLIGPGDELMKKIDSIEKAIRERVERL
jgi:hypothetical protein